MMGALFEAVEAWVGPGTSVFLVFLAAAALACGTACCCCGALVYSRLNWHPYSMMSEDVTQLTKSTGWWGYNFAYVAVTVGFFVMAISLHQLSLANLAIESISRLFALIFFVLGLTVFMLKWGIQLLIELYDSAMECFRGDEYEVEFVYEWTCSTDLSSIGATLCSSALCVLAAPTFQIFGEMNKMQKPKRVWRMGKWWGGRAIDKLVAPFNGRRSGVKVDQNVYEAHPDLRVSDQITQLKVHVPRYKMAGARKLEYIDIVLPKSALLLYIHSVTVRLRKPGKVQQTWEFPAYIKLGGNTLFARVFEGEASIPFYDSPAVKQARADQIAQNKELWGWQAYTKAAGLANSAWGADYDGMLPAALDAGQGEAKQLLGYPVQKQGKIPINSLFGVNKAASFYGAAVQAQITQFVNKFKGDPTKPWASTQEVLDTFKHTPLAPPQLWSSTEIASAWQTDEEFGAQLLQGVWPDSMAVVSQLPPRLKAALAARGLPEKKRRLDGLMREKKLLLTDLSQLSEYQNLTQKDAAIVSCYILSGVRKNSNPALMPEAILLWWNDSASGTEQSRLYTPADSAEDWLLAKTYARQSMSTWHELVEHALQCHLAMEPFCLSARRNLSTKHPLFKMLWPHIRYTMVINFLARAELIAPGGTFDEVSSIGGPKQGHIKMMSDAYKTWHPLGQHLPTKLKKAGLLASQGALPAGMYAYRDAALPVWDALRDYVARTLKASYPAGDTDVRRDTELQAYLTELETSGFPGGRFVAAEFNSSVEQLIELFTTVLWTVSGRHASVNFLQYEQMAYGPNMPLWMDKYPPAKETVKSVDSALQYMCTRRASVGQAAMVWILSEYGSPWLMLNQPGSGDRYQELFSQGPQLDAVHHFARQMDVLEVEAKKRARTTKVGSKLEYVILVPSNIPTSVAI